MTSTFYFTILAISFVGLASYLILSAKTRSINSWVVVSTVFMMCILSIEAYRETLIAMTGDVPQLTYARAGWLRVEHTYLGLFLGEVIRRVQVIISKGSSETD